MQDARDGGWQTAEVRPTGKTDATSSFWVRAFRRTPSWIIFLILAALYVILLLGKDLLTGEPVGLADIAAATIVGLVVSAVIFWIARWKRARDDKNPSGSLTATNFERAMSSGRLPQDAAAEQWIPELVKAIRTDRIMAWVGPLLFGGFTGLGIFLITQNPEHPWFWVLATTFFVAIAIWYPIWTHRRRKKLQGLISQFPT